MKLKTLHIKNLRNIDELTFECSNGIHFIHGPNAQGKTTLLEAIYLLSNLRSFRDHDAKALVKMDTQHSVVRGSFLIDEETEAELKVELILGARLEKRAYINHKLSKSAADYFGLKVHYSPIQFHAITLNPTSTDLIRGEPALRRTYLNQMIASEDPKHLNILKRYQKALDQKNALLKQEHNLDPEILTILNETLIKEGSQILHDRLKYLQKITPLMESFLKQFAPDQRIPKMGYFSRVFEAKYKTQLPYFTGHFELPTLDFLVELYHHQIQVFSTQERVRKTSLVGPHRDDLVFKIGEVIEGSNGDSLKDLVEVGSQGEVRSLLLALKLAELEQFQSQTGVQPVLLIDDFSSELDQTRRGFLLDYLKDSQLQIFVTSTDDPAKLNAAVSKDLSRTFKILQGSIVEE